ncbi:hypothetical protein Tsubulata_037195 [Turnera subulata]|uniref:rRNA N-glycosylase n=1 Tax=Turnera subulata TaxID=218843 RepID=A0A9Q0FYL8_9ROSI|nr:hypothetical protein Tsubulata_037195 [Turnera subulata]
MVRTIHFSTFSATENDYRNFMAALRNAVAGGTSVDGTIVMRNPSRVPDSERHVFVELTNKKKMSITLAIDVTTLGVVGCRTGGASFFFNNYINQYPHKRLFQEDTKQYPLGFDSDYPAMERVAQATRAYIPLGVEEIPWVISHLYSLNPHDYNHSQQPVMARGFLVVTQLVSEAARFKYIEGEVIVCINNRGAIGDRNKAFTPDVYMIWLEDNWDMLCKEIHGGNKGFDSARGGILNM